MSALDARWQEVTCRGCGRTYTCTPEDDYYNADSATTGVCLACLLAERGHNPDTTPVLVINLAGGGTDPRDLSRAASGAQDAGNGDTTALTIRERALRSCGARHSGICWTERFVRWSTPGAWIPEEYRSGGWYRLTPEGRAARRCQ